MNRKRILIVGGTGYLGQHLLQGYAEINGSPYDLAFTHHSSPPPQTLLNAIPGSLAFHVDLKTGEGFDAISNAFGQVLLSLYPTFQVLNLVLFTSLFVSAFS